MIIWHLRKDHPLCLPCIISVHLALLFANLPRLKYTRYDRRLLPLPLSFRPLQKVLGGTIFLCYLLFQRMHLNPQLHLRLVCPSRRLLHL